MMQHCISIAMYIAHLDINDKCPTINNCQMTDNLRVGSLPTGDPMGFVMQQRLGFGYVEMCGPFTI